MAEDTLPNPADRTVQAITAVGIVLVAAGAVLDVGGIEMLVLAFGLALSLAGIVYLATPGDLKRRYWFSVAAVVAGQLTAFGGTVGLVGIAGLLAVGGAIAWLSLRD